MAGIVQLNYDELNSIIKNFHDEGEDITQLLSTTRQRVQELRSEWIGDAADKFFDEMEHDLLPALLRLSQALFISQDVLSQITKTIHAADEENAGQFKGDDFGASGFEAALGAGGGAGGGLPGVGGLPADFGAGKFEQAGAVGGSGGDPANTPQSPASGGGSNVPSVGVEFAREPEAAEQEAPAETEPQSTGGGGGGGGGGGSGQGLQGDLKQMGVGLVGEGSQSSSAGGPQTLQDLPDHVFTSGGGSGGGGNAPAAGPGGGSGPAEPETGGGSGAAAGIAGVAGSAAAAAAAKALKKAKGDE